MGLKLDNLSQNLIHLCRMKKILITSFAMSLGTMLCHAEEKADAAGQPAAQEAQKLDISQAFPGEEAMSKMKLEGTQVCTYMMDHEFAVLQKKLEDFLGKSWKQSDDEEIVAEAKKDAQKGVEATGMKIMGLLMYEHVENPLSNVMLMQMSMPEGAGLDDSKTMVTLTYMSP